MRDDFRARLRSGETVLGTMITIPSATTAEVLAPLGFDWFFVDGEHGPLDTAELLSILQAVGDRAACIVRVPSVDEVADEPAASTESSARPTPRQQLFVAETPAVVQERSAKVRAAEASAQASERRRNATGAKRLADPSATGPPRL